jgi:hypothetical protein
MAVKINENDHIFLYGDVVSVKDDDGRTGYGDTVQEAVLSYQHEVEKSKRDE